MGNKKKDKAGKSALGVMTNVLKRQEDGTTLKNWKRQTYNELMEKVNKLPKEHRVHRILSRLRLMVEKDELWEKKAQEDEVKENSANKKEDEENVNSQIVQALSSAMLSGVMENNRKLHRIRRELLEDIENLEKAGKSSRIIIKYIKRVLLR